MSEQVQYLQTRIGQLTDRVLILETNLKDTQEKIQSDVKRLADLIIEVTKNPTLVPPRQ